LERKHFIFLLPLFVDVASSSHHVTSDVSTSSERRTQKNAERSHKLICVDVLGETEENQRNSRPQSRSPARDLNPAPPECKAGVLISLFTVIVNLLNTYLHIHRNQYTHPFAITVQQFTVTTMWWKAKP